MKEHWRISKEELVSTEEGLKSDKIPTGIDKKSNCRFDHFIEWFKLILYIILILVIAVNTFILWNNYNAIRTITDNHNADIKSYDDLHSDYDAPSVSDGVESSTISNTADLADFVHPWLTNIKEEVISALKDQHNRETNTEVDTKSVDDPSTNLWDDLIKETVPETTTTSKDVVVEDSVESLRSKEDDQVIKSQNSLDIDDYKEDDSGAAPVLFWDFPFLWTLYSSHVPPTDDYAKENSDLKLDEILTDIYDSNENNDEIVDLSEFLQTSHEKVNQNGVEQNESNFTDDDSSSLTEPVKTMKKYDELIEDLKRDLLLQMLLYKVKVLLANQASTSDEFLFPTEANESDVSDASQADDTSSYWIHWDSWDSVPDSEESSKKDDSNVDESKETSNEGRGWIPSISKEDDGDSVPGEWVQAIDEDSTDVNEDVKEGTVFFGPRIENDANPCEVEYINGLKTIKCAETTRKSSEETSDMDKEYSKEKYEDSVIDKIDKAPIEPTTETDGTEELKPKAVDVLGSIEKEIEFEDWLHTRLYASV